MRQLWFRWHLFGYHQRERAHAIRLGGHSTLVLLRLSVSSALCAAFTFLVLCGTSWLYDWLVARLGWALPGLPAVDKDIHASMMGTIAQASAAVLALFFAAISVVASTSYSKLGTGIRSLIAYDDLNRRYLRLLAHVTALSIIALVAQSFGYQPNVLVTGYIALIAVISILCFFALGARTFALFSPAALVAYPLRVFVRAAQTVTPVGRRWLQPSFQNHAGTVARQQLETIEELLVSAMSDDHPSMVRAVHEIAGSVHRLSRFYAHQKSSIPSDSNWFAKKAKFSRLQLTTGTETEIAIRASVVPAAPPVPDMAFVEQRCDDLLVRCLRHTLKSGSLDDAVSQLLDINATATERARLFQHAEATKLADAACDAVLSWILEPQAQNGVLGRLQAIDVACVIALAPILNTAQALTATSPDKMFSVADALLQGSSRAVHSAAIPQRVLAGLEDVLKRISFEHAVEGRVVTQRWYVEQLIGADYARFIREVVDGIVEAVSRLFLSPSKKLVAERRGVDAAVWLHRSIEACHKAETQIRSLAELYATLKTHHHTEAPWYPLEHAKAIEQVLRLRAQIVGLLAECIPLITETAKDESLPDLIGQARVFLADELITLMENKAEGDAGRFAKLFAAHFKATLAVSQCMFDLAQQPEKSGYVRAGMDAMLDALELSGMAVLFSEMDGTSFGKLVCSLWTKYLGDSKDEKRLLTLWLGPIEYRLNLPLLSSSGTQRFYWERRFVGALQQRGVVTDDYDYAFTAAPREQHPSPVIRSLHVHLGHLFDPPSEYFAALVLAPQAEAAGVPVPRAVNECRKSIARQQGREAEDEDA